MWWPVAKQAEVKRAARYIRTGKQADGVFLVIEKNSERYRKLDLWVESSYWKLGSRLVVKTSRRSDSAAWCKQTRITVQQERSSTMVRWKFVGNYSASLTGAGLNFVEGVAVSFQSCFKQHAIRSCRTCQLSELINS